MVRTLLIDNYDSFTYNLFHYLASVSEQEPVVVKNDEPGWRASLLAEFDNVVLSPGPGTPEREADFGICAPVIRQFTGPLLGICLGHQGIAALHGGRVAPAAEPRHGRCSTVFHDGSELFTDIPSAFTVVRYHSLVVDRLPAELEPTAWTADGTLMALRHRERPQWGVQFHPESLCTEYGERLLGNFLRQSESRKTGTRTVLDMRQEKPEREFELLVETMRETCAEESAFERLFADSTHAFWLDSSKADTELGRFSIMGDASGPLARVASADVASATVTVHSAHGTEVTSGHFLDWLDRDLRGIRVNRPELPFDFALGWIGYLGYELKAQCGGQARHRAPDPDAHLVFADRAVVFDNETGTTYLLALAEPGKPGGARHWLAETRAELANTGPGKAARAARVGELRLRHDRTEYLGKIAECQRLIGKGETYEVCLTNMLEADGEIDPLTAYRELRTANPAPFAALLAFGGLTVLSTSPERFLKVGADGALEARPIKGTRPRGSSPEQDAQLRADLADNEKDRAENLMIVDLVRNDLGRCTEIGSVDASESFRVESYATVHQLVSTVRARLRPGCSAVDCVRAAFPGGSMTGAPKVRTMRIIDELEDGPRGVYSGAIGYFSLSGAADFSIAIRTLVHARGRIRYGVGGAIVALSEPEAEFEETAVKAAPLLGLLGAAFPGRENQPAK